MTNLRVNSKLLAIFMAGNIVLTGFAIRRDIAKNRAYADNAPANNIEETYDYDNELRIEEQNIDLEPVQEETKNYYYIPAIEAKTGVNVRRGPSTDDDVIGGMTPGSRLPLIGIVDNWFKINYFGEEAYVSTDYANEADIIAGKPNKIVICNQETTLTTENGYTTQLPQYELCFVYQEFDDKYLVSANNTLGTVSKYNCSDLNGIYAVVDLSDQRVDIYKDNEVVLSTPCVTGKDSSPTTVGYHQIHSEKHHDYLEGPGYKSYVDHFLAFHNGEGLHDAQWRTIFGNDGYHENGSHGCVNLPHAVIEDVNNLLDTSDTVIVKH